MNEGYKVYDAAGNQTQGTVKGTSQNRTYDAENRLSIVVMGTTTLDFVYDANGRRVIKNEQNHVSGKPDDPPVRTLYVGNLYEEELTGSGSRYICYYYLGSKLVGMRRVHEIADHNGQFRIVGDQLGSTTLVVDSASPPAVAYREYYKPYGEALVEYSKWGGTFSHDPDDINHARFDWDGGSLYFDRHVGPKVLPGFCK
jgi:hypothetical protein